MVDTYTPILWATLTEEERYAEYIRVRVAHDALLAACKALLEENESLQGSLDQEFRVSSDGPAKPSPVVVIAEAAIAKAEGRSEKETTSAANHSGEVRGTESHG